jgi:hypothetical protein
MASYPLAAFSSRFHPNALQNSNSAQSLTGLFVLRNDLTTAKLVENCTIPAEELVNR